MNTPERFSNLPAYAFPRLRALLDGHEPAVVPGRTPLSLSLGEPQHPMPPFLAEVLNRSLAGFGVYPDNNGLPVLLEAISGWISRRYGVSLGPERLMVLNGTREGLYNAGVALFPERKNGKRPTVLIPNPFYQAYAMAAAALGCEPVFVAADESTGFLPDFHALPEDVLERAVAAWICSPANPQGAIASESYLEALITLGDRYDFKILADECYSEIWRLAPPPGILSVAAKLGADPERVLAFHSLSKRSNLPGLRSGFVAGGPKSIAAIRQLRAYAGAPVPNPIQEVSAAVWSEESHVEANLALYQRKFAMAEEVFRGVNGFRAPEGGFFLWLPAPAELGNGEAATLKLWREEAIRVLPGAYLARTVDGVNPGDGFLRVALVAPEAATRDGLTRLRACLYT